MWKNADLIVSFGGDGVNFIISSTIKEKNIPIFSINYGNLGYITKINKKTTLSLPSI